MSGEPKNYKAYYQSQLEDAHEFQDFVAEELYKTGLPLFNFASKKYQISHGENKLGIEIKLDKKFKDTGNLYIELSEKSHPDRPNYVESGINRNDNCWLYVIGDKERLFIFSKKLLKQLFKTGRYREVENKTKTSNGFLLPAGDAEKYAAKVIDPSGIVKAQ